MATPIGTNVVTSIARRFILPEVVDNVYNGAPLLFRLNAANKRIVQGGTQIEVPLMYQRFATGGPYQGFEVLDVAPSDTVKNGAWDWKQYYTNVTVDGLTLIKTDSPESIANFIQLYFAQAEMEMAENLATGLWTDGTSNTKHIDGLKGAVDDTTVLTTYAGLTRTGASDFWSSTVTTTQAVTLLLLNTMFGTVSRGGRHPTIIVSQISGYNKYFSLVQSQQQFPAQPGGHDEMLASAGFTNLLFNNVPWVVDSHVPNSVSDATKGQIFFLNEDYLWLAVSPRADFYLEDFQTSINQDAMVAKLLWAGNLIVTNCKVQGRLSDPVS